ncbi:RrF2 family transcriptional regulator [Rhodobacter capsulatus]|nr:Rrf2 family transcriptional regulator [Rhodobacter capsulatus]
MHLLASTDFALRALLFLATDPERLVNTETMSRDLEISRNHLQKVVQALVAGGFARTLKGPHGGVRLARPATEIRIGAVVRHFEERQPIVACFAPEGQCVIEPICGLKGVLAGAQNQYYDFLNGYTLEDCLRSQRFLSPAP